MGEVVAYKEFRALRSARRLRRERTMSVTQTGNLRREQRGGAQSLLRGALASRVIASFGNWDEV